MKTRIIMVGGFLGAGKTTLLMESARSISETGKNVGLITNDQASELVDTAFLKHSGRTVFEVSGSCFCCNFNGFYEAISQAIENYQCDIIIAEPVGSCTDLSATIMQPLKQKFQDVLIVAPLTVLVDPDRLANILDGGTSGLHESAAYILCKQLDEADIILLTKNDLQSHGSNEILKLRAAQKWPLAKVASLSAKSGIGMKEWLDVVLNSIESGTHLVDVDYDTYAEGEAVLGWLNASYILKSKAEDWDTLLSNFIHSISNRFDALDVAVGHVKLLIEANEQVAMFNLTGKSDTVRSRQSVGIGDEAKLTINARVQMTPEKLENIVAEEMSKICGDTIGIEVLALKCLSPGRPNPTYHYDHVF